MDSLAQLILNGSTTLDVNVLVRIVIFAFIVEFIGIFFDMIGKL